MQHQALSLLLTAALLPWASAAVAGQPVNIIVVTTLDDGLDDFDGKCSLREAIFNANNNLAFSVDLGECPAGRDDMTDVIVLQSGETYQLTEPGTGENTGDLRVLDELLPREIPDLRIETTGGESAATIEQTVGGQRVMEIFGATVEIDNVIFRGGSGVAQGGGIRNESGHLTLTRCGLIANQANRGGGLWNGGDFAHASLSDCEVVLNQSSGGVNPRGAGIKNDAAFAETDTTELFISNTVIRLNTTTGIGGGVHISGGRIGISNGTVIALNSARFGGGAIFAGGEISENVVFDRALIAEISDTRFESNSTFDGGAGGVLIRFLNADEAPVRFVNVDFIGNHGAGRGGGLAAINDQTLNFDLIGGSFVDNTASVGAGIYSEGGRINGTRFEGNEASLEGGALALEGDHTVIYSTFIDNRANGPAFAGLGGAILHMDKFQDPTAVLDIRGSHFIGNSATVSGGAIHGTEVEVIGGHFAGNSASVHGGAIFATRLARLLRSRLIGNSALFEGGALRLGSGSENPSVLLNSVVANNEAGLGGGIYLEDELIMGNSTISGNRAVQGGGLYVPLAAEVTALYSTITNNTVGRDVFKDGNLILQNSIFGTPGEPSCFVPIDNPTLVSMGHNISADPACGGFDQPGDQAGVNPLLASLAPAAGGTFTHEPMAGSPALGAAEPTGCGSGILGGIDQRGALRPFGGACDIGAHERGASLPDAIFADGFEQP